MKNLLFILFICTPFLLISQGNINDSLIASYPFNGNANDESDHHNDGEVIDAILTTDRFGNENSAYEFNGTSSYINIPNSESLQSPENELSLTAWVYPYSWSLVGSEFGPILTKSNTVNNSYQYRLNINSDEITTSINLWTNTVVVNNTINFNEWYFIVSILKNDTIKVYVNGDYIDEGILIGPINQDTKPLQIGRDTPGVTEVFHGKMDDIRIYNRAITQDEVNYLFDTTASSIPIVYSNLTNFKNYPNPFSSKTTIEYELDQDEKVILTIFNKIGQQVYYLAENQKKGKHNLIWNTDNYPDGVYSLRLVVGQQIYTRKLVKVG